MPRRDEHVRERAVRRRARSRRRPPRIALRRALARRSRPSRCARAAPRRARGTPRPSGGSGRSRARRAAPASAGASAARTASPGNDVGRQCPSLSERISRWRIAPRARRQTAAGSSLGPEDGDLLRLEPAASQRLVGGEAGEPAADDGARRPLLHRAGQQPLHEVALEGEEDGQRDRRAR